jgi:hypothetical protein
MKIRSLLLGSIAAAGLSTAGYAADLGVITALDVCDELGISGLTISSDDNCLAISGSVSFGLDAYYDAGTDTLEWDASGEVTLAFEATAPTDFGPATAYIGLISDYDGTGGDWNDVEIDEAFVSVGDTTVVSAGYRDSLFNGYLDAPEGAYEFDADIGNNLSGADRFIGFQISHAVADGFGVGAAIEQEVSWGPDETFLVGVATYQGNGIAAESHVQYSLDTQDWSVYAGFQGYFDPVTVAAAFATDNGGDFDAFLGAAVTIDMFTLAGWVDYNSAGGGTWVAGGRVEAGVTDEVTIYVESTYDDVGDWTAELGIEASVTETLTADAHVGTTIAGGFHAGAGLTWEPGGDTEFSVDGEVWDSGDYAITFSASKDFQ